MSNRSKKVALGASDDSFEVGARVKSGPASNRDQLGVLLHRGSRNTVSILQLKKCITRFWSAPCAHNGSPGGLRASTSLQVCRESRGASNFMSRHRIRAWKSLPSAIFPNRNHKSATGGPQGDFGNLFIFFYEMLQSFRARAAFWAASNFLANQLERWGF